MENIIRGLYANRDRTYFAKDYKVWDLRRNIEIQQRPLRVRQMAMFGEVCIVSNQMWMKRYRDEDLNGK